MVYKNTYIEIMHSYITSIFNYLWDMHRYIKYSSTVFKSDEKKKLGAEILRISHAIEKGMALPKPKNRFGQDKFLQLLNLTQEYKKLYSADKVFLISEATCRAYLNFHRERGFKMNYLSMKFNKIFNKKLPVFFAGNLSISGKKLKEIIMLKKPELFFHRRYSIRQFSKKIITKNTLNKIVFLASKTPSVCNRQGGKVYFYTNKNKIKKILELQVGNKGFGDTSAAIAIVTSELSIFNHSGERNQGYVDGGLFAMSLVYAAHSLGLATCMMNWSNGTRSTNKLRKLTDISNSKIIITLIAIGHIKKKFAVTSSPRKNLKDFLSINKPFAN